MFWISIQNAVYNFEVNLMVYKFSFTKERIWMFLQTSFYSSKNLFVTKK